MKILIAPDKFKGCLSAREAASLMARGARRASPGAEVRCLPLADGGDGTAAVLRESLGGRPLRSTVPGPRGEKTAASWTWFPKTRTALVELAQASGLALLKPSQRDPLLTTTYGAGRLVRAALARGAENIWIALGGSATVDGAAGMLQALGARLLLKDGAVLREPAAGRHLSLLGGADFSSLDPRLKKTRITLLCDVDNPLLGRRGAARAFGPQKGASPKDVAALEKGLRHWASLLLRASGVDVSAGPRLGAAGGTAAGLTAALGARAVGGADAVMEAADFERELRGADVVLTGEGAVDRTSLEGKVVAGVLRRAARRKIPVLLLAGRWGGGAAAVRRRAAGSALAAPGASVRESLRKTERLLPGAAEGLLRAFLKGRRAGRPGGARGGKA